MKEAYSILPVYTGDVSGACSALFELGGMVVIHDPSGCNSTYNTHDELRWYDQNSLIFLSGLTEMDAILGDDDKLIREVEAAAYQLHPKFIALTNSPIPYMNGTDLEAIAIQIEEETGIPTFYIPTNGMHDYVTGAGYALERIVEKFVIPDYEAAQGKMEDGIQTGSLSQYPVNEEALATSGFQAAGVGVSAAQAAEGETSGVKVAGVGASAAQAAGVEASAAQAAGVGASAAQAAEVETPGSRTKVNLLGVTPLDFGRKNTVSQLKEAVSRNGYELLSCFAMGDSLETLTKSWQADKNIVVSAVGMKAALMMEEACGIPWETGEELLESLPLTEAFLQDQRQILTTPRAGIFKNFKDFMNTGSDSYVNKEQSSFIPIRRDVFLIGEPITMQALAAAIFRTYGNHCFVISTVEASDRSLLPKTVSALSEEEVQHALREAEGQILIADPLYRFILPKDATLCELPHLAFSGRIYFGLDPYEP